jgi:two-component system sensor histidine kinase TctE
MRLNNHYNTLRSRLLGWLLIPLLVLSIAHIANTYLETRRTSTELYDKMLVALALTISEGDLLTGDLLELICQATNDKLYYKVLGPDGSFVVGYEDMPAPEGGLKQINNHIELYDAEYLGRPVRVIAASIYSERPGFSGWSSTFVAQTLQDSNGRNC